MVLCDDNNVLDARISVENRMVHLDECSAGCVLAARRTLQLHSL